MGQAVGRAFNVADWVFPLLTQSYDETHRLLVRLPSDIGVEVPAMLVAPEGVARSQLGSVVTSCVIYFHANACDIGQCVEDMLTFRDGAMDGDAVVLCPEYPGYGLLRAYEPSVAGINRIAQAAWTFCIEEMGFSSEQVLLWGRSIGTGPATALARSVAERWSKAKAKAKQEAEEARMNQAEDETGCYTGNASQSSTAEQDQAALPCLGGLVLLAPFISISAVIEHHLPSRLVASVVGPMWEILDLVKDAEMEEVPLCVIHPKSDEVVPSSHGQAIFERAACRLKYGVWLCNATHNIYLTEEHLGITRRFLAKVTKLARRAARRRRETKPKVTNQADAGIEDYMMAFEFDDDIECEEIRSVAEQLMEMGAQHKVEDHICMSI